MQAIRNKLRSRRGASLTFALLLFLVCAVVGSVVLVAGTAASGRMSQIAEMDQRYYSVNSAARLLIDTIDGEEVTIVETKPDSGSVSYQMNGSDIVKFNSISEEAAYFYITEVVDKPGRVLRIEEDSATPLTISLAVGSNTALSLNVREKMKNNGDMVLTVAREDGKDTYAMELTFTMDARPIKERQTEKTVTTWKITWHIQNVEIIGSSRWKE